MESWVLFFLICRIPKTNSKFTFIDSGWGPKCIWVPIRNQWEYIYKNLIIVLGMRQEQKNMIGLKSPRGE